MRVVDPLADHGWCDRRVVQHLLIESEAEERTDTFKLRPRLVHEAIEREGKMLRASNVAGSDRYVLVPAVDDCEEDPMIESIEAKVLDRITREQPMNPGWVVQAYAIEGCDYVTPISEDVHELGGGDSSSDLIDVV
jgi:hypothetical protein